jgi:hypothetical protein
MNRAFQIGTTLIQGTSKVSVSGAGADADGGLYKD